VWNHRRQSAAETRPVRSSQDARNRPAIAVRGKKAGRRRKSGTIKKTTSRRQKSNVAGDGTTKIESKREWDIGKSVTLVSTIASSPSRGTSGLARSANQPSALEHESEPAVLRRGVKKKKKGRELEATLPLRKPGF